MARNLTTGTAGLIAVDKVGNEILFLDPITYEMTKSINGFAPNVHELLVSEDHTVAYVPISGDGIHGKNPNPGHLISVIDLVQQRHLAISASILTERRMACAGSLRANCIACARTAG